MKIPSLGTLAFAGVGLFAIILIAIGAPHDRPPPAPAATSSPSPPSVTANGFTLTSTSVDLPIDEQQYPDGPHADVINANCTSCHSPSMAMTQPKLAADQWKATVTKMRDVYHAPVAAEDVNAIVEYLLAMPTQKAEGAGQPAPGSKSPPKSSAASDASG